MVETSSPKDAFARRSSPAGERLGAATDHFKRSSGNGSADHFKAGRNSPAPGGLKYDAFARARAEAPAKAPAQPAAPQPAKPRPSPKPEPAPRAAAFAPPKTEQARTEQKQTRSGLHVVASQAGAQPSADALMFGSADHVEAETRVRRAGKTSSLVLVTGGGMASSGLATASSADTLEAPPPVAEKPAPPPQAGTPPPAPAPKRSRGGGGGDGSGPSGPGPRGSGAAEGKRRFNQDDIAGVIFGLAVIAFLMLWMLRGRSEEQQAADIDPLLSTQFAATDTGPPPPFTPQVDPFGDRPVDLKPKGAIPEALPEATPAPPAADATAGAESAQVEAAPPPPAVAPTPTPPPAVVAPPPAVAARPATPAAAAAIAKLSSHAWFCTGSSTLTTAARNDLARSIEEFRPYAKEPLVVHAFADTRGTGEYNLALSGARARVVADFLRTNGLEVVESEGKGELTGLADNQNCANQRRADIFFKAGSELRPSAACLPPEEVLPAICN